MGRLPAPALLLCLALLAAPGCATPQIRSDLTPEEVRADLAYLKRELPAYEATFTPATKAEFDARIEALAARSESLTHGAFVMGVQWALAAVDNGHTEARVEEHLRRQLPVEFAWFADGLYVVAAHPDFAELLGARVIALGGQFPESLLDRLDRFIGGTRERVRVRSPSLFRRPEAVRSIGAVADADRLPLRLYLRDGRIISTSLTAQPGEAYGRPRDFVALLDDLEAPPLYLRDPDRSAFRAWLPGFDALYVRINANHDKTLLGTLQRILRFTAQDAPRHAVVDLRHNGGGDYGLTAGFAEAFPELVAPDGKLFIVTGNRTYSAAIVTAAILKDRAGAKAVVVGEKVGDTLQFWSEGDFLVLPNSGLRLRYSDGYHDWATGYDEDDPRYYTNPRVAELNKRHSAAAGTLDPDIPVSTTFADYAAGRDPVMAAIMSLLLEKANGTRP